MKYKNCYIRIPIYMNTNVKSWSLKEQKYQILLLIFRELLVNLFNLKFYIYD